MTHTTQIEFHPDRPIVHFVNPGVAYWQEEPATKPKKKKKPKPKEPKTYYPGRDENAQTY